MKRWTEFLIPLGVIACLLVIFVPLPASMMDVLLAANITISVVILLTSIYVRTPLELNLFPALLLATTFARLALNISTTRLILTRGAIDKEAAAGGVIQSFGEFVAGNDIAVGLVIFAIIVIIQFVVITKGATRISEVAARFALDGLPGKQMAIDADLNAELIDSETAQFRREQLGAEADFYGAMDGASKFVRGDAIAGIFITILNIAGGLIFGLTRGMSISESAETFTMLTIGDGLVSQLPALLVSLSAALLITRSSRPTNLPSQTLQQLFSNPKVLFLAGGFLVLLVFTNLPALPLLGLAAICFAVGYAMQQQPEEVVEPIAEEAVGPPPVQEIPIDRLIGNDVLEMELGRGLIRLADPNQGGQLLNSISAVRKQLAKELGLVLPKVRVRDNLDFPPHQYRINIQGNPIDFGELEPDCALAVDTGMARGPIDRNTIRGIFNDSLHTEPAYWVPAHTANSAMRLGYVVMNATDVLADQLKQICFEYAADLLTRDATQSLLDETEKKTPAVVKELIPEIMSVSQVQKVLKNLVSEKVSIRPLGLILETLGDYAAVTQNHLELTELVRQRLARQILSQLQDMTGRISAFSLSDELTDRIEQAWDSDQDEIKVNLPQTMLENLATAVQEASLQLVASGKAPVAVVPQAIRPVIARLASANEIDVTIIGDKELGTYEIQIIGSIGSEQLGTTESQAA